MTRADHQQLAVAITQVLDQLTHAQSSLVPAVAVARQAATAFGFEAERRWLELELRGYDEPRTSVPRVLGEVLGVDGSSDLPERVARCRALEGEVVLELAPNAPSQSLPYPYFATQSIAQLETLLAKDDGVISATVPWRQLPAAFHRMFQSFGVTEQTLPYLPVYFKASTFSKMRDAIRAEVAGFLATVLVMCQPEAQRGSFIVENVRGHHVQIIQAATAATVTINDRPAAQESSSIFATLVQEIETIQDLVIGNRKQILAFADDQEVIKAGLLAIVHKLEERVGGAPLDVETLRTAAEQVIAEMRVAGELSEGALRRLVNHGVSHSVLGSTVFEALKALFLAAG